MESFIYEYQLEDLKLCDDLINYHKNNSEYKHQGRIGNNQSIVDTNYKDSIDVNIIPNSKVQCIIDYYKHLEIVLNHYLKKYPYSPNNIHTLENMKIQHYKKGGGYPTWHCERMSNNPIESTRTLVFMTYLNNVDDGGTEWFYQNYKTKAVKGLTLIWPSDFTHTHRGIISNTKEKYIITGWFNFI